MVGVVDIEVRDQIEQFSPVSQFLNSQLRLLLDGSMISCVCMYNSMRARLNLQTRMFLHVLRIEYLFVDVRKIHRSCYPVAISQPKMPKRQCFVSLLSTLFTSTFPSFLPDSDNYYCQNNRFYKPFKLILNMPSKIRSQFSTCFI